MSILYQDRSRHFNGGELSKNIRPHGWKNTKKKLKLHWLKRPKAVTKKQNLDPKLNDSKPNIWRGFFSVRCSST